MSEEASISSAAAEEPRHAPLLEEGEGDEEGAPCHPASIGEPSCDSAVVSPAAAAAAGVPCSLSKNAVKRAINKARKAAKLASAKAAAERYVEEHNLSRQVVERASEKKAPGKAGRAKAFALHGLIQGHSHATHRAAGGVAVAGSVKPEHAAVVAALEALETAERLRSRPHLGERRAVVVDPHGTMEAAGDSSTSTGSTSTSTSTSTSKG